MLVTCLDLSTHKLTEFLFFSPVKSLPNILRQTPIGVTKNKKIIAIAKGATNLPKSIPSLNQIILARKKVFGLVTEINKNPQANIRAIHQILEVGKCK